MKLVHLVAPLLFAATPAFAGMQIAVTFDDLPSHGPLPPGVTRVDVATQVISALRAHNLPPVYGFVNGLRLKDDPPSAPVLQMWRDAGFPLGNHTYSHMNLNGHTAEDWVADTLANEPVLTPLMGDLDWRWLRYPYLAEGETPLKHAQGREFLASRNYRVAAVTMNFDDFQWNEPYARCVAKKDDATIAKLETSYLKAAEVALDYYHDLSMSLYGRDIPYVLLMHIGAFDARMLPRLLELYESKGVSFITLEEAERDEFYRFDVNPMLPPGPVTLEQALAAQGVVYPGRPMPGIAFDTLCK